MYNRQVKFSRLKNKYKKNCIRKKNNQKIFKRIYINIKNKINN